MSDANEPKIETGAMERAKKRHYFVSRFFPQFEILLYLAEDDSGLATLQSRIPDGWGAVMDIEDWFERIEGDLEMPKRLILTHYRSPLFIENPHYANPDMKLRAISQFRPNLGIPEICMFLPHSVITYHNGRYTELRDQTGFKWGNREHNIPSHKVLNDE